MSGFDASTPAVWETGDDPAVVSRADVEALIAAAGREPLGRARMLLHPGRGDGLHEMVIALPAESCDHPHINFRSGKSFLALSGRFAVMVFSDDGTEAKAFILSAGTGAFLARLRAPAWHTIVPLSGPVVFLETILGPFEGNRFAPWFGAPGAVASADSVRRLAREADASAGG